MRRGRKGFTLIEVMITLVILFLVLNAVSTFFVGARGRGGVLNVFKQQSRIAQSGMDAIAGLELLRKDLESAGYGLPWNNLPAAYSEAAGGTAAALNDAPSDAPRGIVSADGAGPNSSDYLAIKATSVAADNACRRWTTLQAGDVTRAWVTVPPGVENLAGQNRVIVLTAEGAGATQRSLVIPAASFSTTFNNTAAFAPASASEVRVVYGIADATAPRMPFNRADYFLSNASVPQRCAPNTGVLVKAVIDQADGNLDLDGDGANDELPLLDCVAAMQVLYLVDTNGDGAVDGLPWASLSGLTASQIREQVKAVRVFLLAHEGQKDEAYLHASSSIVVGEPGLFGTGAEVVDLTVNPELLKYRWKLQILTVDLPNLRG